MQLQLQISHCAAISAKEMSLIGVFKATGLCTKYINTCR